MGAEAVIACTVNRKSANGKARLETDVLQFRGDDLRLSIPFKAMRNVRAAGGVLRFDSPHGGIALELGAAAPKWAEKILHPPSRLAKIGVKPDWRVVGARRRRRGLPDRARTRRRRPVDRPRGQGQRRDFLRRDHGLTARSARGLEDLAEAERRAVGDAARRAARRSPKPPSWPRARPPAWST